MLLDHLRDFPPVFQAVVDSVPRALRTRRAADDRFALVEHAHHLADLEIEGYGDRIARMLAEDNPVLPDFRGDVIAEERRYRELELQPAADRFRTARESLVERLRALTPDQWSRVGTQEGVGAITLDSLARMMFEHDLGHANDLLVLLPELGVAPPEKLASFVKLAPSLRRSA